MPRIVSALLCSVMLCVGCSNNAPTACADEASCDEGMFCSVNEICIPAGECRHSADCSPRQYCNASNTCATRVDCTADGAECGRGEFCSSSLQCLPVDECRSDADCGEGHKCSQRQVCIADNACLSLRDCGQGTLCTDGICVPGSACGEKTVDATIQPVNLLILLDRSQSMTGKSKRSGSLESKWTAAWKALLELAEDPLLAENFRWGLNLFPDTTFANTVESMCSQTDGTAVPMGGNNAQSLVDFVLDHAAVTNDPVNPHSSFGPNVTPITQALWEAAQSTALADPNYATDVVLITDGQIKRCADGPEGPAPTPHDAVETVRILHDTHGANVHVVAFDSGVDEEALTNYAEAGGTAIPLAEREKESIGYVTVNAANLKERLSLVLGSIASCSFSLEELNGQPLQPDDLTPDVLSAFLVRGGNLRDNRALEFGGDWSLSGRTVTLQGSACEQFKSGEYEPLFTFECPDVIVE